MQPTGQGRRDAAPFSAQSFQCLLDRNFQVVFVGLTKRMRIIVTKNCCGVVFILLKVCLEVSVACFTDEGNVKEIEYINWQSVCV